MGRADAHVRAVNAQVEELRAQADEARAEIRIEYEKLFEVLNPSQEE
jgi:Spy/CpxP family protein refolding chaperone